MDKSEVLRLNWDELSAMQVWRRYRAVGDLGPMRAGVWARTGVPVRLSCAVNPAELVELDLDSQSGLEKPGSVVIVRKGRKTRVLCVRCREGWVGFEKIFYGQKKAMTPLDFLNGLASKVPEDRRREEARFDCGVR